MSHLDATLLQIYKKIFFPRDLFVLTLKEWFATPEHLYFSVASSQNKRTFFKKERREANIIYNVKQLPRGSL